MSQENTLHLAITMAGAVSAGAYTAGVMDYLLEVLDKWEELKKANDPRVPKHNIKLEILSGASAGGMTAAITSVVLHYDKKQSICAFSNSPASAYGECAKPQELETRKKGNRLYNSWVNLTRPDMLTELLKTDDEIKMIGGTTSCISALNSNFIKDLATNMLSVESSAGPLAFSPYVSDRFRLFVTLTNLDGYERAVGFAGQGGFNPSFLMYDHRDLAFFRFTPHNGPKSDGSIQVDLKNKKNTDLFIEAGIATGAFPIGLAYRTFSRDTQDLQNNLLINEMHKGLNVKKLPLNADKYRATFLDGGIINNEPFDLTEILLQKLGPDIKFLPSHNKLNCVTLMIDPFPSEARPPTDYGDDLALSPYKLSQMLGKLLSAFRTQVLVKTDLIQKALDEKDFSCFIMAPRRKEAKGTALEPVDGTKAIACGSLGGFGGFLDKGFREHDFYLGRINCKSFLQKHFCVPLGTENEIFKNGYSTPESIRAFTVTDEDGEFLPIIPDVNKLDEPNDNKDFVDGLYRKLEFPSLRKKAFEKDFSRHKSLILGRVKFIIKSNFKADGLLFKFGLWWFGDKIYDAVYNFVYKGLKDWKIIKD